MQLVLLSFVLASALAISSARDYSPSGAVSNYLAEHHNHIQTITHFSCQVPQKRLVSVQDLMTHEDTRTKTFFPDVTVVHRCDHSCGSCLKGKVCTALHSHYVKRVFHVTFLADHGMHKRGETDYVEYDILEDSLCHCEAPYHH